MYPRKPVVFTAKRGIFSFHRILKKIYKNRGVLSVEKCEAGFNSNIHNDLNRFILIYLSIYLANVVFLIHLFTIAKAAVQIKFTIV